MGFSEGRVMDEREQAAQMERAIENMLPAQRQAIAEASLAGCTFQGFSTVRRLGSGAAYRKVNTTSYFALMPDGKPLINIGSDWVEYQTFEDIYEAACACLAELNKVPAEPLQGFVLDEGNEQ